MQINSKRADSKLIRNRLIVALAVIMIMMGILMFRMIWLQITHYEKYQELADGNRIRVEPIVPIRGRILDRNGIILADNQMVYVLELHRDALPRPRSLAAVKDKLEQLNGYFPSLDETSIRNLSQQWGRMNRHQPFILTRISETEAAAFAVDEWKHPGFSINAVAQRTYPQESRASHVVGYVGRTTVEDLKTLDPENYRNTDFIGRSGIEQSYEAELHGRTGLRYMEVDAKGRAIRELERIPPTSGKDLLLTIDLPLQSFAEDLLGNRKGAIVAIDPRNGGILAMASTPTFNPNQFITGMSAQDYQQLIKDPNKPLLNRATQSRYPPGSTIKPFMGIVGLEANSITAKTRKYAGPAFEYKGMIYRDWKKEGHGMVDLDIAITQSSDVFFYELALDLTINRMDSGLQGFGFGEKTGIDLVSESAGLRPNPLWKRRVHNKPWYPGETIIAGIGQGYMLTTPLQLTYATATLAMHGQRFRPHLAQEAEATLDPLRLKNSAHWQTVIDAMINVMHAPNGTGKKGGLLANTQMAGKTGTAQVVAFAKDTKYNADLLPEEQRDHALFVGFAPAKDPSIAMAVMIENGGSGGSTASPVAGLLVDFWLKRQAQASNP